MSKAHLKVDWATHAAARHACQKWHYTGCMPVGKLVKIGAWERGKFIGVVLFAWGSNHNLGKPYGLKMTECCELVRVALTTHEAPVSRVLAIALRFLKTHSPGIRAVISFADPEAGHVGGIYQATNWVYTGTTSPTYEFRLNGKRLNKRAYTGKVFGNPRLPLPKGAVRVDLAGKYRYIMPLDDDMHTALQPLSLPYPKRQPVGGSGDQPAERPCKSDLGAPFG